MQLKLGSTGVVMEILLCCFNSASATSLIRPGSFLTRSCIILIDDSSIRRLGGFLRFSDLPSSASSLVMLTSYACLPDESDTSFRMIMLAGRYSCEASFTVANFGVPTLSDSCGRGDWATFYSPIMTAFYRFSSSGYGYGSGGYSWPNSSLRTCPSLLWSPLTLTSFLLSS